MTTKRNKVSRREEPPEGYGLKKRPGRYIKTNESFSKRFPKMIRRLFQKPPFKDHPRAHAAWRHGQRINGFDFYTDRTAHAEMRRNQLINDDGTATHPITGKKIDADELWNIPDRAFFMRNMNQ